jgi:hypothetical protein
MSNGSDPTKDWDQGYGFQFWRCRHGAYRGDGAFGQFCLVLPDQDAVVAMTAGTEDMQGVLDLAWAHLLPALSGGGGAGGGGGGFGIGGAGAEAALADRLSGLALPVVDGAPAPSIGEEVIWDGFTGIAAEGPLVSVRLDQVVDGWRLTLTGRHPSDSGNPLVADLHTSGWTTTAATTPAGDLPLATSGAWMPDGSLRVDVVFLETPHRLELTLRPSDRAVTTRWATYPLGEPPLTDLRAPRV